MTPVTFTAIRADGQRFTCQAEPRTTDLLNYYADPSSEMADLAVDDKLTDVEVVVPGANIKPPGLVGVGRQMGSPTIHRFARLRVRRSQGLPSGRWRLDLEIPGAALT